MVVARHIITDKFLLSRVGCNWFDTFQNENLAQLQKDVTNIVPVIYWLKNQVEPSDPEIRLTSPETKALWFCKVDFSFKKMFYIMNG